MLRLNDLHVHYGAVHALQGVELEVNQGEIVTLIGSNGAGKSTTLRAISGMLRPSRGTIDFEGKPIAGLAPHVVVGLGIAHSPEGRGVFANLTVEENLQVGAYTRSDKAGIAEDMKKVYGLFPRLEERRRQLAGTLSGGEQQMLAMGRALLARPRLLLLDEPSLGLAPQIVKVIFQIIRDINALGTTILLVEQNAHKALEVANRGYVIEVGKIVLADDAKVLAASDEVRKAYLGG
ncbi:MAG: ABC transporter ATP-binding protein [Alphaproteobacteria bacterium]|nr:ABC transporter ATP-binding protein [Alphaproteobacteria bacterium]